jgi:hypothetical protein
VVGELKQKTTKAQGLRGSDNESGDDDSLLGKNVKTPTMSEKHLIKDAGRKKRKLNTGGRSSLESSSVEKIGMIGLLAAEEDEDDATTSHEKVSSNAESDMSDIEDKKSKDKKVLCFTALLPRPLLPCHDHPLSRPRIPSVVFFVVVRKL